MFLASFSALMFYVITEFYVLLRAYIVGLARFCQDKCTCRPRTCLIRRAGLARLSRRV